MASESAKQNEVTGLVLGGVIGAAMGGPVGAGIGALIGAAVLGRPSAHAVFERHLRARLATHGIELAGTQVGRDGHGSLWIVTLRVGSGPLQTLHASVPSGPTAFAQETAVDVADRIAAHLL